MINNIKTIPKFCLILSIFFIISSGWTQDNNNGSFDSFNENRQDKRLQNSQILDQVRRELGPDWQNIVMKQIESEQPEAIQDLLKRKRKDPQKYEEQLARLWEKSTRLKRIKMEDPLRYKSKKQQDDLDRQCKKLAKEYEKSKNESQKNTIKNELRTKLDELFVLRENEKVEKIKKLEAELEKLKEMVKLREQKKQQIIEKRLNELLNDNEALRW